MPDNVKMTRKKVAPKKVTRVQAKTTKKSKKLTPQPPAERAATTSKTNRFRQALRQRYQRLQTRRQKYLARRPHRSFRLTRRRDYARTFGLPGYFAFTIETAQTLWRNRVTFSLLGGVFFVLFLAFNLSMSQDSYQNFHDLLYQTAPETLFSGVAGSISKAGLLLYTSVTQTADSGQISTGQRVSAVIVALYVWLTVIWLLRNRMAGRKVGLRDGVYNAGAPIIPLALMVIVLLLQLIPLAFCIIFASAAWQGGFLDQGAWAMLAVAGLLLVATLSIYWITSTLIAMIIVTLPGMYPMRALTIAGDLVVGRRLRLVYRFVWMVVAIISWWVVIMIPVILLDNWLKSTFSPITSWPIVPIMLLIMSIFSLFWSTTYTYLLYRKMVDDDASPA